MNEWNGFFALIILLSVIVGLFRVFKGPTRADRMLSAQLCGTSSSAILLLLAFSTHQLFLCDIALVFAMLSAVAAVAFVKLIWRKSEGEQMSGN